MKTTTKRLTLPVLGLLGAMLAFSGENAQAATINVPGFYGPTIQAAINAAVAGDTINVAAGTYSEQLTIAKALTINGADGAVLDGTGLAPTWTTGVKIKSGNVTFNNIDVANFTQDGIIIGYEAAIPGSLQNVHITNCKISNIQPGNHGFGVYAGYQSEDFKRPFGDPKLKAHLDYSGLLIENNEITGTKSSALVLQSITGTPGSLLVRNNNIHDGMNDGIWIDCAWNIIIQDNIVKGNADGFYISSYADNYIANSANAWIYEDPWMPHLDGPYSPENILITGNTISDNITYGGVYLESGHPATILINENAITGNAPGVANLLSEQVTATCNWWGDASGPSGVGPGTGDSVTAFVDFTPWMISPSGPCSGPDSDADGITDALDNCPNSDMRPRVDVNGSEPGQTSINNTVNASGCTIQDWVNACAADARNHGQYVSCITDLANQLYQAGAITKAQCQEMISGAAKSKIGK